MNEGFPIADVSDHVSDPGNVVWFDLCSPTTGDLETIAEELGALLPGPLDHVLRVAEWTDTLRDLLSNLCETHMCQQGFRLNEIMKSLTSWAAIIAVPTMITGYYGQNVPYPGFGTSLGFWSSTIVILTASGLLSLAFKRRGWL